MAKKLETCGVFGVSSSEYLGYAEANRDEWVKKGQKLVEAYLKRYRLRQEGLQMQNLAPGSVGVSLDVSDNHDCLGSSSGYDFSYREYEVEV